MTGDKLDVDLSTCQSCTLAKAAAEAKGLIGTFVPQCDAEGLYMKMQCWGSTGKCWCADRMTGDKLDVDLSTCQVCTLAKAAAEAKGLIGTFIPQCDADGFYSTKQCWGSTGECWCADRLTGEKLTDDLSECTVSAPHNISCAEAQTIAATFGLLGSYVPQCEADGSYRRKQCQGGVQNCWCADPVTGAKLADDLSTCQVCTLAKAAAEAAVLGQHR
eukprot:TRINITY_DN182_c0_g1_i8.p1 TRINITY_DN182_c0_g1~~TRINITY_DN182_c0_g1_i8.p1  ORF type:complete len:217 (+),score=72.01 TRINITY_DN182_c0_g1_i8:507-1157(+)